VATRTLLVSSKTLRCKRWGIGVQGIGVVQGAYAVKKVKKLATARQKRDPPPQKKSQFRGGRARVRRGGA
jgi:hypothetical protein